MTILWKDDDLPSADDPSETVEESIERLTRAIDANVAKVTRIRYTLRTFYLAPVSAHSIQPILNLALELNPGLQFEADVRHAVDDIITPESSPF